MPLLKTMKNNEVCIIADGKSYRFDFGGRCCEEDCGLTPEYVTGVVRVNTISVLQSGGKVTIAVFWSESGEISSVEKVQTFECKEGTKLLDITSNLQTKQGYNLLLTRKGEQNGVSFTQAFFVYNIIDGVDNKAGLLDKLSSVKKYFIA